MKYTTKAALAGASLFAAGAFATAADANCRATVDRSTITASQYTVTYDLTIQGHSRIANEIEARFNADAGFRTVRPPEGQAFTSGAGRLRSSESTRVSSGELSRLISDYNRGGTDLIELARGLCATARNETRVPTITREVTPTPVVRTPTPAPVREPATVVRTPAPAPREYFAPETSPRPEARPEMCQAEEVQPAVVIEVGCDCEVAEEYARQIEASLNTHLPEVDVVINEEGAFIDEDGPITLEISVQNGADGIITTSLNDENSATFSVVSIDTNGDGEMDRETIIGLEETGQPTAIAYILSQLNAMEYAPVVAAMSGEPTAPEASTGPVTQAVQCRPAAMGG